MYNMYPWDKTATAQADHRAEPHTATAPPAPPHPDATDAVQVALDRRDNGGDAVSAPDRQ